MGEYTPKIRFKGFTDDWEERKLKELGDIQTGNTPPTSNADNYSIDGMLWVTPTDIKSLVISDTSKKLSEAGVLKARTAKAGSILVTSIASIGKNTLVTKDVGFNQQINALTPTHNNDSYFLLTQSEKWSAKMKQTAAAATMQIVNKTDFSNISTLVPVRKEEQQKIGSFFKQLDNTIALHQRQLDLLKEQKKGFLQKMFPKQGAKVPELRFAGFDGDWEERKLGDISGKVTEKNSDNEFSETLTNSAEYGIISQRDFFDKDISNEKNLNTYYVVRDGDFVYNPRISNFAPVGPIKRNTLGRIGVMSPLYYVFRARNVDGMYLEKYFSSTKWHRFMELNGDTGARADRFAIKDKDFVQMPILLPTLEEQSKIARFLDSVDTTITLQQRKLDLLKEQKKALLQKMFV